jgi:Zn-dependent peptidase ImmA (M78 family)/transcriptional regulator with XRE-family HTH domain
MPRSADALVKPEMLVWARESAHLDLARAAQKMGVDIERLETWESGQGRLTVKQLRKLAHIYRQPFAAFYLPIPPEDRIPKLTDYRTLPSGVVGEFSYDLTIEIRAALDRRGIMLELLRDSGVQPPAFNLHASLEEDMENLGRRIREFLGVTLEQQVSWRNNRLAFNAWRDGAERAGVLVFQARGVEVTEMRGFSVSEHPLPVILVNRKDAYAGRVFSLLHEAIHLALHRNGICDLAMGLRSPEEQRVEVFCNHVAGAVIAPAHALLDCSEVRAAKGQQEWPDEVLSKLARTFGTSREAILRRLLILGLTTSQFYERKRAQYAEELRQLPRRRGFAPPATDALSVAGKPFARTVLDSFYAGRITASDVADYLGVRLKHLPAITQAMAVYTT